VSIEPDSNNRMDKEVRAKPNPYLNAMIAAAMCSDTCINMNSTSDNNYTSRLELDSHANMPVVGCEALVINDLGISVDVCPFSPDYPSMKVKLVDAVLQYDCPLSGKVYMLLVRNAIHVPAMKNSLIPPFILRLAGITVNDVPKIQVKDPTVHNHVILFPETKFFIPLKLFGIFSSLPTSKPSVAGFEGCDKLYQLTPTKFNPHSEVYARNEDGMRDWEGNMIEKRYRDPILLDEVPDDPVMTSALQIGATEAALIDDMMLLDSGELDSHQVPFEADKGIGGLLGMSPLLSEAHFCAHLEDRGKLGRVQMALGATTVGTLG
jgi:hypothetical protein